jgi:hypothetical protein
MVVAGDVRRNARVPFLCELSCGTQVAARSRGDTPSRDIRYGDTRMIRQLAITAAGIGAAIVLTVGLAAAGFGPRPAGPDPAMTEALAQPFTAVSSTAEPTLEPEIVYVMPAPAQETVVVERQTASGNTSASGGTVQARAVRGERDDDHGEDREDRDDHDEREDREDRERDDD